MALPGSGLIGFATPKAVGNTPRRNRLKRRFRAAVRECGPLETLDVIVAIAAAADRADYDAIKADVADGLKKIEQRWAKELESS
jgi:ribonuclease P protein component